MKRHADPKRPAKYATKGPRSAKARRNTTGVPSKDAQFLEFLKCSGGAILKQTHKYSGQARSVRGFLSGTLGKTMGLTSTKANGEERRYSVNG
jgi:hypothetical protein